MTLSACLAPATALYLTPSGDVQACCFNVAHPLGNVAEQRLLDIWHGARAQRLRDALAIGDLSRGCQACAWSARDGAGPYREYDQFAPPTRWPRRLELALSNRCNLACVMCNGELSSTIRSRREGRRPLATVYDDRFFDDLAPFLAHADQVKLLGGEPLLAEETYRVLETVIRVDAPPACHLTTNATVLPPRALALMERRPLHFAVSIDGWSRRVFESIRVGADRDQVMANFVRLRDYCRSAGTTIAVAFSLMRQNWHELLECLQFAEANGVRTVVNTVVYPTSSSIWSLPREELARVLETLHRQRAQAIGPLELNGSAWTETIDRLEHRVTSAADQPLNLLDAPVAVRTRSGAAPTALPEWARRADHLDIDEYEIVTFSSPDGFLGLDSREVTGRPLLVALHQVGARAHCEVHVVDAGLPSPPRTERLRLVPLSAETDVDRADIELTTVPAGAGARRVYARWLPPSPDSRSWRVIA